MFSRKNAQNWLDRVLYPFESKYVQLEAGSMHYVDEGKGEILLFVHGTPTWSFLYRDIIKTLSLNYRCIAIDHLGFGLSANPGSFSGTPQDHAKIKKFACGHFVQEEKTNESISAIRDFMKNY